MPNEPKPAFSMPRLLLFEYSELNPAMRADPHALFDPQRAERPVEHDGMIPAMLITAHRHGRDTLRDPQFSRNFNDAAPDNPVIANVRKLDAAVEAEYGRHDTMLTLDGDDHSRVRGIVAEAFLKRAAKAQKRVADIIDERLDTLQGRDGFDAVNDYATQIPIRVLGGILGSPEESFDDLKRWTEGGQLAFDPTKSADQEKLALEGRRGILGHYRDLMAARRIEPRDDLVSDLLAAQSAGADISDNEILHNLFALLVAGHLTTADLIGNGIWLLLTHSEARAAIAENPALINGAVEEILRFEPPISYTARFTKHEGEIKGCPYHGGDALVVSLLAANHDPARFAEPHSFDISRKPNPHLAFGAGAHICIGAPLARIEGQLAIGRLLARFPHLRLRENGPADWRAVPGVRGLARLDVMP
ncbi:cytochrome P450 [Asticcacaulis sp. EMRT-3]|uniref:cytochrome P450 n=1 Tax=Asticcacaulis sp. EMRT-3 TaxID=3040349 RepID=UPI0024AF53ED|nr:cytochrome P450 [Asticcacaulis sp. EMRT-3]MDI7775257.1 cytochrome P450 [Asticcacaulis sp. EMRT-3]